MYLKLRHLETFVEVARQRSIVKAADALHVSQPAISKTMRELEDRLGVTVVERDGRGIRLTNLGELFLRHASASVAALRQGLTSIKASKEGSAVPIRVGALPTVSSLIMAPAMKSFLDDHPRTRVRIVTGENRTLLEQLRVGELDLVVGRLAAPELMTGLTFEHLYSEVVKFVVRPGHPLLGAERAIFEALPDYVVLVPTPQSIIRSFVDRLLITNGVTELPRQIETVSDTFSRAFMRDGDAVWIISSGVVANDIADGHLAALPIDTGDTQGPVGLTMRATMTHSPALTHLLEVIRQSHKRGGAGN